MAGPVIDHTGAIAVTLREIKEELSRIRHILSAAEERYLDEAQNIVSVNLPPPSRALADRIKAAKAKSR